MNQSAPAAKPQANPRRLYALLALLTLLIVVGLTWGVRHYFESNAQLAIRDRRLNEARTQIDRIAWWGDASGQTSFLRARVARLEGDLEAAAQHLTSAAKKNYDPLEMHVEQLMFFAQGGHVAPLLGEMSMLIEQGGVDTAELYFSIIRGHEFTGNLPEAKTLIDNWRTADSSDPRVYYEIGRYQELKSDGTQAKEAYERAVELAPYWIEPRARLANLLLLDGDAEAAARAFQQALVTEPNNPDTLVGAAVALTRVGELDQATEALARLHEIESSSFLSRMAQSELFVAKGKYSEALDSIKRCTDKRPDDVRVNRLLERIYLGLSDESAAKEAADRVATGEQQIATGEEQIRSLVEEKSTLFGRWLAAGIEMLPYDASKAVYPLLVAVKLESNSPEAFRMLAECFEVKGEESLASRYQKMAKQFEQKKKEDATSKPPTE